MELLHGGDNPAGESATPTPAATISALVGPVDVGFATITLEACDDFAVPRLHVTAHHGSPITDEGVARTFETWDMILARAEPLTVLYDLRGASTPSRKQIGVGSDWIRNNSSLLDRYLQGIAIMLSSFFVRSVVSLILHVFPPPQPNVTCSDEGDAFAFARDKCTVIKEWVSEAKKRKQVKRGHERGAGDATDATDEAG